MRVRIFFLALLILSNNCLPANVYFTLDASKFKNNFEKLIKIYLCVCPAGETKSIIKKQMTITDIVELSVDICIKQDIYIRIGKERNQMFCIKANTIKKPAIIEIFFDDTRNTLYWQERGGKTCYLVPAITIPYNGKKKSWLQYIFSYFYFGGNK